MDSRYGGPFGLARMAPDCLINTAEKLSKDTWVREFTPLVRALKAIDRTPFEGHPVNPHVMCRFVIGSRDEHFQSREVVRFCNRQEYDVLAFIAKGEKHTPCGPNYQFNGVGRGMMEQLTALVNKWRSYQN